MVKAQHENKCYNLDTKWTKMYRKEQLSIYRRVLKGFSVHNLSFYLGYFFKYYTFKTKEKVCRNSQNSP